MNEIQKRKKESNYLIWISKIINEDVKNVNICYPTVVDVKLSNDGSHLKIYMTFDKNEQKSLDALNATKGFIRTELSKYESGRKVPSLIFVIDEVAKKSLKIDQLLEQIKKENEKNGK